MDFVASGVTGRLRFQPCRPVPAYPIKRQRARRERRHPKASITGRASPIDPLENLAALSQLTPSSASERAENAGITRSATWTRCIRISPREAILCAQTASFRVASKMFTLSLKPMAGENRALAGAQRKAIHAGASNAIPSRGAKSSSRRPNLPRSADALAERETPAADCLRLLL